MMLEWLSATLLPFFLAILLLHWMLRSSLSRIVVDHPGHRSLHSVPVPRTGGLAIMGATLVAWMLVWQPWMLPLAWGAALLVALSFVDDVRSLSAAWRFIGHFVVATAFTAAVLLSIPFWMMASLAVAIVWMTNLYNFMDGSDGLAGGMALFGFGAYAIASWLGGDDQLARACLAITAAAGAFLLYNFHPARVFMGDAGSIPLGFLAAALGLVGWQRGDWPMWLPILVFSPFIVDATLTLLKRLLKGEKVWQAHRSHYYQRLVQVGWGHRKTALWEYVLMVSASGSALWMIRYSATSQSVGLVFWGLIYWGLAFAIDRCWSQRC